MMMMMKTKYRCVRCGFGTGSLFVQYSPGNIRLMKCENCKAVADEYIECEVMILVVDLILHKSEAYRHLLYNVVDTHNPKFRGLLWKCTLAFLLLDAYRSLFICRSKEEWGSAATNIDSLVWTCQKILKDVILGNLVFVCTFLIAARALFSSSMRFLRYDDDISIAILLSSYSKLCLCALMVWEFPSSVVFIIDLYVLSSNVAALKAVSDISVSRSVVACLSAHLMKIVVTQVVFR